MKSLFTSFALACALIVAGSTVSSFALAEMGGTPNSNAADGPSGKGAGSQNAHGSNPNANGAAQNANSTANADAPGNDVGPGDDGPGDPGGGF